MAKCSILLACFLLAFAATHFDLPPSKNQGAAHGTWLAEAAQEPPPIPEPKRKDISPLAKAYFNLGKELYWAEKYDGAIENFERALAVSPKWGDPHLYMGISFAQIMHLTDAEVNLIKALEDPSLAELDRAWAYRVLGSINSDRKNYDKAETYFRAVLKYDPGNPGAYNSLAFIYARQKKNLTEALRLINYALGKIEKWDHLNRVCFLDTRSWVYYQMGDYEKAEKDTLESLRLADKTGFGRSQWDKKLISEIHYHLGEIYLAQNKNSLARSQFQKALHFRRGNKEAQLALERLRRRN